MFEPVRRFNIKEKIHAIFKRRPFIFGIVSFLVISITSSLVVSSIASLLVRFYDVQVYNITPWNSAMRILASLLGIWVLGVVLKTNGLKFTFSPKGFAKGMLVLLPLIIMAFAMPFVFVDEIGIYSDVVSYFPSIIMHHFAVGLHEEVLYRGVLMTAVLISFSPTWDKKAKRIIYMIIFAAIFGLVHVHHGWVGILLSFSAGFLFCAAYTYTKNLLACVVVHWMVNTLPNIIVGLLSGNFDSLQRFFTPQPLDLAVFIVFWIIQIITAVILTIKAKPFVPVSEIVVQNS